MISTIKSIEKILQQINTHPEFSNEIRLKNEEHIRNEANCHSLKIESIEDEGPCINEYDCRKNPYKRQLQNGREYLIKNGFKLGTLQGLGKIIEPTNPTGFRQNQVLFGDIAPPECHEVPFLLEDLIYRLNEPSTHPILKAVDAHVDFVRIHPYEDGNGRAARILQNTFLEEYGYPVPIIPFEEKEHYIQLMNITIKDRINMESSTNNPSKGELLLQSFIAGKIYESADRLKSELSKNRSYSLMLYGVEQPGAAISIAKKIRRKANLIGAGAKVSGSNGSNRKVRELKIIGGLSSKEIESIVQDSIGKGIRDYSLKIK